MGVHRARQRAASYPAVDLYRGHTSALPILDLTLDAARIHAELGSALRRRGITLGAHDALIAATAFAGGHALLTTDPPDFNRVPGSEVLAFA